ncbi:MAG: hypothetical protein AAFZ18_10215 [Myxococcota bacterium]
MALWAWLRGLWPFGRLGRAQRPDEDSLSQRVDSAVRSSRERDLLRGAEESLRRGRREDALRAYRAALEVFEHRGAYLKSAAVLATLTRIEPDDPGNFEELARVQEQLGRRPEADASRRQAALLREARGESTLAASLRASDPERVEAAEGLQVHARPRDQIRRRASSEIPPAPVAPSVSEVSALDLGPLEPDDMLAADSDPTVHLTPLGATPPADATAPNPVAPGPSTSRRTPPRRGSTSRRALPPHPEPPLPEFDPLEPGIPPADTDASELFEFETFAPDEAATQALPALTPEQLRGAEAGGTTDAYSVDEADMADRTLWDPGFKGVEVPESPTPNRPRGLAFPPKPRPSPSPTPSPTPRGRSKGLDIPTASTTVDPHGSSAAASARRRPRGKNNRSS